MKSVAPEIRKPEKEDPETPNPGAVSSNGEGLGVGRASPGLAGFDPARGPAEQFGRAANAQLLLEMFAVGFDRLGAEVEDFRNLARAAAVADEPKHPQLARTERSERRGTHGFSGR